MEEPFLSAIEEAPPPLTFLRLSHAPPTSSKEPPNTSSSSSSAYSHHEPPRPPPPPFSAAARIRRSRTVPNLPPLSDVIGTPQSPLSSSPSTGLLYRAAAFLLLYLSTGVAAYLIAGPDHFSTSGVEEARQFVDALYFSVATMCTVGYGDIAPTSAASKLFTVAFVLVGFGFVDILLGFALSRFLDIQEGLVALASTKDKSTDSYIFDVKKGRVRIRLKVGLALAAVVMCIGVGACVLCHVEHLSWLDALYLAVMSVTTVGYGDHSFRTMEGRLFASVWLLFSTLMVARAFLYLAEARVDRRCKDMARRVLAKEMTIAEFLEADINDDGIVRKSEFVICKLKEMGKISDKDISQICNQFRKLDVGNCGKIKLGDLFSHHPH